MTQDTPSGDVTPITLDTGFAFFDAAAATMAATEVPIARVFANLTLLTAAALASAAGASADSRAVALVVTDAAGAFLPDVRADEVVVLENGAPRALEAFERDLRRLAVALVLDTSAGAGRVFRVHSFDAVWRFVTQLPDESQCVLWSTGERPRRMGALDGGRPQVEQKVGQAFSMEGANALMDTLVEAAGALGRESQRRRALVVLTGAGAGHTNYTPGDVTARVRRASAPVLALMYAEGEAATAGSLRLGASPRDAANLTIVGPGDHERILSGLAEATGGRHERVLSATAAVGAFEALPAALSGQYRLRYVPAEGGGPRRVEVRVSRPGARWRVAVDTP